MGAKTIARVENLTEQSKNPGGKPTKGTKAAPFKKGCKPGPGRPAGSRNKASLAIDALLEGQAEGLTQKAIDKALEGDVTALRLCLDRVCPPRKDRPIVLALPKVETAGDSVAAIGAILQATSSGEITPSEGQTLASILIAQHGLIEVEDIEQRLRALETKG